MDGRNIVLIGMPGSGKTTVAKVLEQRMRRTCLELDQLLVERTGISIPEIVDTRGWDRFRDMESSIALEVSRKEARIISTGGGVVLRSENMMALRQYGFVVYLKCTIPVLVQRIGVDLNRPLITPQVTLEQDLTERLRQRERLYTRYNRFVVDGDNQDVDAKVAQILEAFGRLV